ncbi:MAG TPA: tetratricopeptide repeat protein [Herbaspirillum sp.]
MTLQSSLLEIADPGLFGIAYHSPNKRWIVGLYQSPGDERARGRVALVDYPRDELLHKLDFVVRPFNCAVSDAAIYAVYDAGDNAGLQSDVIVIAPDGRELFERHYEAIVFSLGISDCGRYVAVQTANAPGPDGCILEVLDIKEQSRLFTVHPATQWALTYSFEIANGELQKLWVDQRELGAFSYSASGIFLEDQRYREVKLDKGDYSMKVMTAQGLLKNDSSQESAIVALAAAEVALVQGAKDRDDWASLAHRVRGEALERLERLPEALDAYDSALTLNPKIGVLKRAKVLRGKLGAVK